MLTTLRFGQRYRYLVVEGLVRWPARAARPPSYLAWSRAV
jgi:hypothetical protein